jgi:hypothetical protein
MTSQLIFLPTSSPQAQPDGYETPSLPPSTWMVCPLAQLKTADVRNTAMSMRSLDVPHARSALLRSREQWSWGLSCGSS